MSRLARALIAISAGLLLGLASGAGGAHATVVSVARSDVPFMSDNVPKVPGGVAAHTDYLLSFVAAAGEVNAVTVQRAPDALLVRDSAPVMAGAGCEPVDTHAVRCPTPLGPGASFVQQLSAR